MCTVIALSPDAERAYTAWRLLYNERLVKFVEPDRKVMRLDPEDLATKLADERGTVRGELLQIAVVDAEARTVTTELAHAAMTMEDAGWEVVRMLADATNTLTPVEPSAELDDTCRHGLAYTNTCVDCDEEEM